MITREGERIGLSVGRAGVAGVLVKGGRARAAWFEAIVADEAVAQAVRRCLDRLSVARRGWRVEVHIAVEPSYSQVRRFENVPTLKRLEERHALANLARAEQFLGRPDVMSVFVGDQESNGDLWVMCVESRVVDQVVQAVSLARMSVARFVPAIDLLVSTAETTIEAVTRDDGSAVLAHATIADGLLQKSWRALRNSDRAPVVARPAVAIRTLLDRVVPEAEMQRYSAAAGAVMSLPRSRFGLPTMLSVTALAPRRRRLPMLIGIAASLSIIAYAAPAMRVHRAAERAAAALAEARPRYQAAATRRSRLDGLAAQHVDLMRFKASGAPALSIMSALASALPADGVVTSLAVDSGGAQVAVLVPSATALLQRLGAIRGLDSVTLSGSITHERVAAQAQVGFASGTNPAINAAPARELERVAVRLYRARSHPMRDAQVDSVGGDPGTKVLARNTAPTSGMR